MRKMWQQDVLRYLTNRRKKQNTPDPGLQYGLRLPLKVVRLELKLGGDNAKLSNFINRNKETSYQVGLDAPTIFEKLIQPLINEGQLDPEQELPKLRSYMQAEELIDEWSDIEDYRACLTAIFRDALPRRYPVQDTAGPRLRSQRLQPSAFFVGRTAELSDLRRILDADGVTILSGLGGIGKTMLAEEYARRNRHRYTTYQVVTSEPGFTSYKDLIRAVRFEDVDAGQNTDTDEFIDAQMHRLCSLDASSLLIFDNVDQELSDYALFRRLLRDSGAHIIVTTRTPDAFPEGTGLGVQELPDDEQLQLLCTSMDRALHEDERDAAAELCRRVGGHTLILQLLGRAIRSQGMTCMQMLERLRQADGFAAFESSVRVQKDDFNATTKIQQFIVDNLFSLDMLNEDLRRLMRFLTILPLEGTPRTLLLQRPFGLGAERLDALVDRGWLLRPDQQTIRMHPIVRDAVLSAENVRIDTNQPMLAKVRDALWEPEVSPDLPHLLRLASTAVDMFYISEPLRALLISDRLKPLHEASHTLAGGHAEWTLRDALLDMSADEEQLPAARETLRMYALYCEYMRILDHAQETGGDAVLGTRFTDSDAALRAVASEGNEAHFHRVVDEMLSLYRKLNTDDPPVMHADSPELFLQLATTAIGAELTEYAEEAGLADTSSENLRAAADAFASLSPEDRALITSLSALGYTPFLTTALDAFSHIQALLPFAASTAVLVLTRLYMLLQTGAAAVNSFDEAEQFMGWQFPKITYLPSGFHPMHFEFTEKLWGAPAAAQTYRRGEDLLCISMYRRADGSEFDDTEPELPAPISAQGTPELDVGTNVGPWRVRIASLDPIDRKEAVRIARGLRLEDSTEDA